MYQPPEVRRARYITRQAGSPQTGADRFALAFALFSAFTFMGTVLMMCAVVGIAALLLRSETRWIQLAGLLGSQSTAAEANGPADLAAGPSPLPTPASEAPAVAPGSATPQGDVANQPSPDQPSSDVLQAEQQPAGQPLSEPSLQSPPVSSVTDPQQQITPVAQQAPQQQVLQQQSPLATPPNLQQVATPAADPQLATDARQTPPPPPDAPPSNPATVANQSGILVQYSNNLIDALEQLADLTDEPLFDDGDWTNSVQNQITGVRRIYDELAVLPVPSELSPVHSTLLNAAAQCNSLLFTVESAIASNNELMLETGNEQVYECLDLVDDASSEVDNLLQ